MAINYFSIVITEKKRKYVGFRMAMTNVELMQDLFSTLEHPNSKNERMEGNRGGMKVKKSESLKNSKSTK